MTKLLKESIVRAQARYKPFGDAKWTGRSFEIGDTK